MKRHTFVALLVAGLAVGGARGAQDVDQLVADANQSIIVAEAAVEQARAAIENGKQLVVQIPADSALSGEVTEMLLAASENWAVAVSALEGAKKSAAKISLAPSSDVAADYKVLAEASSKVALSGANVVQTGLVFVEAVASEKSEALGVIREAMQDSLAASSQVQFGYERVKALILEKYSK